MARMTRKPRQPSRPGFVTVLTQKLIEELRRAGIKAEVIAERVANTKVYRLFVIAPAFRDLGHFERQALVWRIAESVLEPDDRLFVTTINTMTPSEMKGAA